MPFLLTDSPQNHKLGKVYGTLIILFYLSLSSPQLRRLLFFFIKNTEGKTLNIFLKKMLELFLKLQDNIRISILKRRLRILYKKSNNNKKTSNQKLNRCLKKTNKLTR